MTTSERRERVAERIYEACDGAYPDWVAVNSVPDYFRMIADIALAVALPGKQAFEAALQELIDAADEVGRDAVAWENGSDFSNAGTLAREQANAKAVLMALVYGTEDTE